MTDQFHDLKQRRLPNWGRWAWINPDRPDSSCANPLYDMMKYEDDDGYGEVTSATIVRIQTAPAKAEVDIDEFDAECLDVLILQTPKVHRQVLVGRYVLRHDVPRLEVDAAVRAIMDVMAANLEARVEMVRRLRK